MYAAVPPPTAAPTSSQQLLKDKAKVPNNTAINTFLISQIYPYLYVVIT